MKSWEEAWKNDKVAQYSFNRREAYRLGWAAREAEIPKAAESREEAYSVTLRPLGGSVVVDTWRVGGTQAGQEAHMEAVEAAGFAANQAASSSHPTIFGRIADLERRLDALRLGEP